MQHPVHIRAALHQGIHRWLHEQVDAVIGIELAEPAQKRTVQHVVPDFVKPDDEDAPLPPRVRCTVPCLLEPRLEPVSDLIARHGFITREPRINILDD